MDGIINIYKDKGFTSHDVVAKLRGILQMKKIGHTGTLDPDATGVLPVCLGKATKVCDLLTDKDKVYEAEIRFGIITDTLDMTGTIKEERQVSLDKEQLVDTLAAFVGEIEQIPPMYSAIKINGKKLYELARKGQVVDRKPRKVIIHELTLLEENLEKGECKIRVHCSKGTYIRSLCNDIGERVGCGAAMKSLVRTRSGDFSIENTFTLSQVETLVRDGKVEEFLMPVDEVFHSYRSCVAENKALHFLKNGNLVNAKLCHIAGGKPENLECFRMYDSDKKFYAVYRYEERDKMMHIVKMFA